MKTEVRQDAITSRPNTPVWNHEPWEGLPSLGGDLEADACVVGLGGSGLACVGELLARGCSVIGLDSSTVAGGAAGRNAGFLLAGLSKFHHEVVAKFGRERAAAIYRLTLREIERMHRQTPDAIRRCGSLRIAADDAEKKDCDAQLAALRADGFAAEPYSGPEGEGLLFPADGVMQPLQRCREIARGLIFGGALLFEQSTAIGIDDEGVLTPRGRVKTSKVLVCVDGRLEILLPELAPRVRTARLQMLATAPDHSVSFRRPVYFRHGYEYWQQLADDSIALGGFRDHALEEEWTVKSDTSERVQSLIEAFLRERLRVGAEVTHRWAASVSYTSDGLPIAEKVRPNVWAAGAYSGTGNVVGSICGRGIAQLALDGESPLLDGIAG